MASLGLGEVEVRRALGEGFAYDGNLLWVPVVWCLIFYGSRWCRVFSSPLGHDLSLFGLLWWLLVWPDPFPGLDRVVGSF